MNDRWVAWDDDPRDYSPTRGEEANVLAYLRNYRIASAMKCDGLDAEQLARRSVPPSSLSLLGLLHPPRRQVCTPEASALHSRAVIPSSGGLREMHERPLEGAELTSRGCRADLSTAAPASDLTAP